MDEYEYVNPIHPLPIPAAWGRGWGNYHTVCPYCGHEEDLAAPMGSREVPCLACGQWYPDPQWEAHPAELPNDGAWHTGRLDGDWG